MIAAASVRGKIHPFAVKGPSGVGTLGGRGADPVAGLYLLDSNVDTPPAVLAGIGLPVLVLAGDEDDDNGTAEDLAAAFPRGQAGRVPGNHMSAVAQPDLGRAIAAYLAGA